MEDFPKVNRVRAIIDLFEDNCRNETAQRLNKNMSKSFSGLSFTERKLKTYATNNNDSNTLIQLENQLLDLSGRLKNYRFYQKDTHIGFQVELLEILTVLCNVETRTNTMMYRKKEQVQEVTKLFTELNILLPSTEDDFIWDYTKNSWKDQAQRTNNKSASLLSSKRPHSFNLNSNSSIASSVEEESLLTPSSFKRSPNFLIGGGAGLRHPTNSIGFDTTLRGSAELRRSTSEVPTGKDQYTRWANSGSVKDRRRPVSLGGTVVILNQTEEINPPLTPKNYERAIDAEQQLLNKKTVEMEDSLQSVNLLKKFFEQKSVEGDEKIDKEKSLDVEENRKNEFEIYLSNLDKSSPNPSSSSVEESVEVSSNDTMIEMEEDDGKVTLSRSSSIKVDEVEGLNTPVLRQEEDFVLGKSLDDVEDVESFDSEQSVYWDPVNSE